MAECMDAKIKCLVGGAPVLRLSVVEEDCTSVEMSMVCGVLDWDSSANKFQLLESLGWPSLKACRGYISIWTLFSVLHKRTPMVFPSTSNLTLYL